MLGLFLVMAAPGTTWSADWREVAVDGDDNRYTVDSDHVRTEGTLVKAVVRADYARPRTVDGIDAPVYAAIDRLSVECSTGSFALESRKYVSARGEEIPAVAPDRDVREFRTAPPGSMAATLVSYLCDPASRGRGG